MTAPPGTARTEEPIQAANPVSGPLPHIPRRWVRDAVRVLRDDGYAVSGAEAWNLIKRWRAWRVTDVHEFIAEEFLADVRRGDLLVVRGKRSIAWRVTS